MSPYIWALLAALCWGFTPLLEKAGLRGLTDPSIGVMIRSVGVVIGALCAIPFFSNLGPRMAETSPRSWACLIAAGILASIVGQIFFYHALKSGEMSRVVPIGATYPLIAFLLGLVVFKEPVTITKTAGVSLVMAGIYLLKEVTFMPQDFSFDVVSKLDLQEVENAVNQANKEISTRFDFKGSVSRIEWDKKEAQLTFFSDDEVKLRSVHDVVQGKLVKRGISLKSLEYKSIEPAERSTVRQIVKLVQGIASDKAKEIVQAVKASKLKVQASIQGDQLRISGKSKDDLQSAMALLRAGDYGLPLQFLNYR